MGIGRPFVVSCGRFWNRVAGFLGFGTIALERGANMPFNAHNTFPVGARELWGRRLGFDLVAGSAGR